MCYNHYQHRSSTTKADIGTAYNGDPSLEKNATLKVRCRHQVKDSSYERGYLAIIASLMQEDDEQVRKNEGEVVLMMRWRDEGHECSLVEQALPCCSCCMRGRRPRSRRRK